MNKTDNKITPEDNKWAALFHLCVFLNFLVPIFLSGIIILIVIKALKNDFTEYMTEQWKEAINFNLTMLIFFILFMLLCLIVIGVPLLIILGLYCLIMPVIAAIKALDGQDFKYPYIIRII